MEGVIITGYDEEVRRRMRESGRRFTATALIC